MKSLECFNPGDHGSTFGGNPLGCAVARTALRVLIDEHLVERSAELGDVLPRAAENAAQSEGEGSSRDRVVDRHRTDTKPARPYCEALKEEGVLCKETHDRVIRIAPPLVISREEIDWAFERIRKVIEGK